MKMFQRFDQGKTSHGAFTLINELEIVEIYGALGLDFVFMDMMVGNVDWSDLAAMCTASDRYGMTPGLRLQSYPWSVKRGMVDYHIASDVLRAISVGAQVVLASLETPEQINSALHPITDAHRRIHLPHFEFAAHGTREELKAYNASAAHDHSHPMFLPILESKFSIDQLPEILTVPGLQAVFIGMSDLSKEFGHPNDYAHPEMQELLARLTEAARKHDIKVFTNIVGTGSTVESARDMVELHTKLGVNAFTLPFDTHVLNRFYSDMMKSLDRSK
jgi:2-keto-3-deoxy-L-rhamnonate aldolase RhmA